MLLNFPYTQEGLSKNVYNNKKVLVEGNRFIRQGRSASFCNGISSRKDIIRRNAVFK
jgi:hypothetical protein